MSDGPLKLSLATCCEALPGDATETLALRAALEQALRRSLDITVADVETMLVLHGSTLDPAADRRLRRMRSHLWLVQDLMAGVDSPQLGDES